MSHVCLLKVWFLIHSWVIRTRGSVELLNKPLSVTISVSLARREKSVAVVLTNTV